MKPLAAIAIALMLGGCASGGSSDYAQYFRAVRQGVAASFGGGGRVTRTQAAAVPFASMAYQVEKGPQQILVLATDANGEQLWTSAAHIVLATRDGRLVRSVGLAHDLSSRGAATSGALPPVSAALTAPFASSQMEDFPDMGAFGVRVNCNTRYQSRQMLTLLGTPVSTLRVDEKCAAPSLNWNFTDTYWLDAETGQVWRSIQHVHPKAGRIGLQILRQPG